MKNDDKEQGLISLEASIALSIFIFLIFFLYSFFSFFEARNQMAHVLLSTANSMSFDTYENTNLRNANNLAEIFTAIYDFAAGTNDSSFVSTEKWNLIKDSEVSNEEEWDGDIYVPEGSLNLEADEYGNSATTSSRLSGALKDRFLAYLSGGDEAKAKELLERYHIVGGLDGISFAGSGIVGGDLVIKITYTMELEFNPFGLGTISVEQSCCSKLWK